MAHLQQTADGVGHPRQSLIPMGTSPARKMAAGSMASPSRGEPSPDYVSSSLPAMPTHVRPLGQPVGAIAGGHPVMETLERDARLSPPRQAVERQPVAVDIPDRILASRMLIVDDCKLQRQNLALILGNGGVSVPAEAWDLPSVFAALEETAPDLVLLSMVTRDSIVLLRAVRETCPQARVIVVGISEDDEMGIISCAEAGVAGYHLRTEPFDALLRLISKVIDGESSCSPRVSAILLSRLSALATQRQPGPRELVLTAREIQILKMLEMGLSNKEIADRLCITLHTVKNHVHSVLSKLGVSTRAEAAAISRSFG